VKTICFLIFLKVNIEFFFKRHSFSKTVKNVGIKYFVLKKTIFIGNAFGNNNLKSKFRLSIVIVLWRFPTFIRFKLGKWVTVTDHHNLRLILLKSQKICHFDFFRRLFANFLKKTTDPKSLTFVTVFLS
jgi:hypothetical protein